MNLNETGHSREAKSKATLLADNENGSRMLFELNNSESLDENSREFLEELQLFLAKEVSRQIKEKGMDGSTYEGDLENVKNNPSICRELLIATVKFMTNTNNQIPYASFLNQDNFKNLIEAFIEETSIKIKNLKNEWSKTPERELMFLWLDARAAKTGFECLINAVSENDDQKTDDNYARYNSRKFVQMDLCMPENALEGQLYALVMEKSTFEEDCLSGSAKKGLSRLIKCRRDWILARHYLAKVARNLRLGSENNRAALLMGDMIMELPIGQVILAQEAYEETRMAFMHIINKESSESIPAHFQSVEKLVLYLRSDYHCDNRTVKILIEALREDPLFSEASSQNILENASRHLDELLSINKEQPIVEDMQTLESAIREHISKIYEEEIFNWLKGQIQEDEPIFNEDLILCLTKYAAHVGGAGATPLQKLQYLQQILNKLFERGEQYLESLRDGKDDGINKIERRIQPLITRAIDIVKACRKKISLPRYEISIDSRRQQGNIANEIAAAERRETQLEGENTPITSLLRAMGWKPEEDVSSKIIKLKKIIKTGEQEVKTA
ncbi:MAG: hypothetical protein NTZ80_01815 [Patescibacteria group bacterium]|nr:hypothetical protein [Patescibacteria group bacterium]